MFEDATFSIRHGTQDKEVFDSVLMRNQYHLPDSLPSDSLIIDIGANVGAFVVACLLRGAGTVACFEPCQENYLQLFQNVSHWPGQAPCFNAAVWRSDRREGLKFVVPGKNTACGAVTKEDTRLEAKTVSVTSIPLDEIIFHATDGGNRRINILKIDAEGSEYSILYTSNGLHLVDQVLVETHQYPIEYTGEKFFIDGYPDHEACAEGMESFLKSQGFSVVREAESNLNDINTLFFATRIHETIG